MGYDEDEAFSKLIEDDHSFIRYDYKKMFSIDKLVRLMEHCKSMNKRMEIRLLYPLDDKVKTARIEMNYYHLPEKSMMNSQSQFVSFLPVNNRHQRLFISKMDLIEWQ